MVTFHSQGCGSGRLGQIRIRIQKKVGSRSGLNIKITLESCQNRTLCIDHYYNQVMMITLKFILKEKVNFMRLDLDPGCFLNGWIWIRFLIKGRIRSGTTPPGSATLSSVMCPCAQKQNLEFMGIYQKCSKLFSKNFQ